MRQGKLDRTNEALNKKRGKEKSYRRRGDCFKLNRREWAYKKARGKGALRKEELHDEEEGEVGDGAGPGLARRDALLRADLQITGNICF